MKRCRYIIMMLTLMIILCSCGSGGKSTDYYTRIIEKYNNIKSYKCKVEAKIISNKTTNSYEMNHYYLAPDNYRVEVLSPESIQGLITVYNGDNVITVIPDLQRKHELSAYNAGTDDCLFITNFFKNYFKSEQVSVTASSSTEGTYTILRADIPGNNIYRCSQAVWFDNKTLLPVKTEIYDLKDKHVISARYTEFEMNTKLEDKIFKIN